MKRVAVIVVLLVIALAAGWWFLRPHGSGGVTALIPTVPGACPDDANDLAGIEGWAPGAGKAEKTGQINAGNVGSFGGALAGSAPTAAPSAKQCPHLAPEVDAYFGRINQFTAMVPNDTYDPNARAAELADANAIFTWVRDHVATEAYAGAMRGYSGTLQSQGGSPADKALLLAGMLGSKGIATRYVHAQLTDDDTRRIITAMLATRPQGATTAADLTRAYGTLGVDAGGAQRLYDAVHAKAQASTAAALTGASQRASALVATLQNAHVALPSDDASLRTAWANDLRDHWWVQAQVGGVWQDLDPTLPDAAPGSHVGANPTDAPVSSLPDALKTRITLAIVADVLVNGAFATQQLVSATSDSQAVYGSPVSFGIGDRDVKGSAIESSHAFTPSISMAGNSSDGSAFDPSSMDQGQLADLRLTIETDLPDGTQYKYERTLFDRRGADGKSIDTKWNAQRTAAALTLRGRGLIAAGDIDPSFATLRYAENMRRYGAMAAYVAAGGTGAQRPPADAAQTYPIETLRFFGYDAGARAQLASNGAVRFFYDRPLIAFVQRGYRDDGKLDSYARFDIVENGMAADGGDARAAVSANVERGVYDTLAEQYVLEAPSDGGTLAVMAAAAKTNVPVSVVNDPKYGGTAIVPARPVRVAGNDRFGWWQVDPAKGNVVGRMSGGAGQAETEYVEQINDALSIYSAISFYSDLLRCETGAITSPLSGVSQNDAQYQFAMCMTGAACSFLTGFAAGELYGRADAQLQALAYNILDLSFDTHMGASKSAWSPGGAWCSANFPSSSWNFPQG